MSTLEILQYPNPILRKRSESVEGLNDSLLKLLDDMAETMYEAPGIGLAAPQVGINHRAVVVDISMREGREKGELIKLINPVIKELEGKDELEEGCLSLPGFSETLKRTTKILVSALDINGKKIEFEADGLLSRVIQHEIDHLNGLLFIDRLSKIKREIIKLKIKKMNSYKTR